MKLRIRIISETTSIRQRLRVKGKTDEYVFRANGRYYEHVCEADSLKQMNDRLNDLYHARNVRMTPVMEEDTVAAATERQTPESMFRPNLESMDEADLRAHCDALGIPHNKRHREDGLRWALDAYYKAQADIRREYDLPDAPAKDVGKGYKAAEGDDLLESELAECVNKQEVADKVAAITGVKLDVSEFKREELEREGVKLIRRHFDAADKGE